MSLKSHGYVCFTVEREERWCGLFHDTIEEALLCQKERADRDGRLDGSFVEAEEWLDAEGRTIVLFDTSTAKKGAEEIRERFVTTLHRAHEQLIGDVGPEVHVRIADNARRLVHPRRPWTNDDALRELEGLYAKSVAELRSGALAQRDGEPRDRV